MIRRLLLWLPPLVYMAAIYHLSSQSNPLPAVTALFWDKALHAVEYGGLAILLARACAGEGISHRWAWAIAVIATSSYGASDEWHQLFTPGRSSDIHDWVADSIGGLMGAAVYLWAKSTDGSTEP